MARTTRSTSAAEKPVSRETLTPVEKPFISEGMRNDILLHGEVIDPLTGKILTKADL